MLLEYTVERARLPANALKYPWPAMQPGDSFLVPLARPDVGVKNRTQAAATSYGKRTGTMFVTRWIDGPPCGYRVWRLL
jgi:hypothetical protein